jgi:hypothetical protein
MHIIDAAGAVITAEIKQCKFLEVSESKLKLHYGLSRIRNKLFLHPLALWDILILTPDYYKTTTHAWVFLRAEIPQAWFQHKQDGIFEWDMGTSGQNLKMYKAQASTSAEFVKRFESRLDSVRQELTSRVSAPLPRPMKDIALSDIVKEIEDTTSSAVREAQKEDVDVADKYRGQGREWSRQEWETRQMEWLNMQCKAS